MSQLSPHTPISSPLVVQTPQTPLPQQPALRPAQFPVEVLWTLEDCRHDEDAAPTAANPARPPMDRAIRHADGTTISLEEWNAIRATARQIQSHLFALPIPTDALSRHQSTIRRGRGRKAAPLSKPKRTKTNICTWYLAQWRQGVERLEREHPVVGLCALHWKADHVIGNALMSLTQRGRSGARTDVDESGGDTEGNTDTDNDKCLSVTLSQTRTTQAPILKALRQPRIPSKRRSPPPAEGSSKRRRHGKGKAGPEDRQGKFSHLYIYCSNTV